MTTPAFNPSIGSYAIGYGKPPKSTQFKKGQSGNPKGRPKDSKNKSEGARVLDKLKNLLYAETYRDVTINEKGEVKTMPALQAVFKSLVLNAAQGKVGAQKVLLSHLIPLEKADKIEKHEFIQSIVEYKERQYQEIEHCKKHCLSVREMLPHPDEIEINISTGEVIFHGPVDKAELKLWEDLHNKLRQFEAELAYWVRYKQCPEAQGQQEWVDSVIRHTLYLVSVSAIVIMRRWKLPAHEVVQGFELQRELDAHVKNGTLPEKPDYLTAVKQKDFNTIVNEYDSKTLAHSKTRKHESNVKRFEKRLHTIRMWLYDAQMGGNGLSERTRKLEFDNWVLYQKQARQKLKHRQISEADFDSMLPHPDHIEFDHHMRDYWFTGPSSAHDKTEWNEVWELKTQFEAELNQLDNVAEDANINAVPDNHIENKLKPLVALAYCEMLLIIRWHQSPDKIINDPWRKAEIINLIEQVLTPLDVEDKWREGFTT